MLRQEGGEAASYWLQLGVSIGIATLGLVVGSAAVVIGAMLVAPLMSPIIGLGMGLASGSPFLTLRSASRICLSVLVAVGGAAAITVLLPFHEMNTEISARTSPTVLDLITAGFCAIAGVYASLRPGSDTAATAAGTSIGISLVPPLCASGYGIGTASWPVARGAALLFTTNLVAIVVVGTVSFVAAGFNRIDVIALERDALATAGTDARISRAISRRVSRLFESGWGSGLRYLMPFVILAAVYIPLRRALDEVAWQVRVRSAVRTAIAREPFRVVESRVRVERHEVEVVFVLIGTTDDADAARRRMDTAISAASGVSPHIEVFAVPDAAAFAGLESTLLKPHVATPLAAPSMSPSAELDESRARVRAAVELLWPNESVGVPLAIDLGIEETGPIRIRVAHLGLALSSDALETLTRALESRLAQPARLVDIAIPETELTRDQGDLTFVGAVAAGARASSSVASVRACVVRPRPLEYHGAREAEAAKSERQLAEAVDQALAIQPRVETVAGEAWSVRFVAGKCAMVEVDDAGPPDAAVPN